MRTAFAYGVGAAALLAVGPTGTGVAPSTATGAGVYAEGARSAAAFVDSIGVNVHLSYHDGPYGDYPRVTALLDGLGIKHVRDGVALGQDDVCREARALAQDGLRFTYITSTALDQSKLHQWAQCVGPALEAYEGLNEYDISHPSSDSSWVQTLQTSQRSLYRDVKSDPTLRDLTVVGPSVTSESAARQVGDLSNAMDVGNAHEYFSGHEPETSGFGSDGYGSIAWNRTMAASVSGTKPIAVTETGYPSAGDPHSVGDTLQAAYLPRLLLEQFAAQTPRTYDYELFDEGGPPFGHYGLVDHNFHPKPAYTALASLIALLREPAQPSVASARRVSFRLSGDTDELQHIALARSDGSYDLILWRSTPGESLIVVTPASEDRTTAVYQFHNDQHFVLAPGLVRTPLSVSVRDQVTIVRIGRARAATR